MADGWIKLHRLLLECSLFANEKALKVWIWCLLKASHKEHKQMVGRQEITLLPGQFIFGRKVAAEELRLSESTVWSLMKGLQKGERINIRSNNKFSLITVVNWDFYQLEEEEPDSNPDNKKTTNGQQMDTNKNVKNGKNEKNNIYPAETEEEIYTYWNAQKIVIHRKLTNNLRLSIHRALILYSFEEIKTAIDHYSIMYHDAKYQYCSYQWGIEKFFDDPKGIESFFNDGQKWLSYLNQKAKNPQPEQEELNYDNW